MKTIDTLIIGGGQAGLAMSRCLSDRSIEHVVLERSRIAERWRSERWDSLRLLTPNWMSRLPAYRYDGPDPDGYMSMPEVVEFLEQYACVSRVPIEAGTEVRNLTRFGAGFRVETSRDDWRARNVVIATGYCDRPAIPGLAKRLSPDIHQLVVTQYRNPDQLSEGGVLIVGAAASGIQLADEIANSGRPVALAVGRHLRMLRQYRGKDILWWLDQMGALDETTEEVYDLETSRNQPALQLVGRPDHSSIDLGTLAAKGVRMVGRATAATDIRMTFSDDLIATTTSADVKLATLLRRIDEFADRSGLSSEVGASEPFQPVWPAFFSSPAPASLDLRAEQIGTVIWATGFKRKYPWLNVPVLDQSGEIVQCLGITPIAGLYVLGLQFQHRRKSAFIDGVGADAEFIADYLTGCCEKRSNAVA